MTDDSATERQRLQMELDALRQQVAEESKQYQRLLQDSEARFQALTERASALKAEIDDRCRQEAALRESERTLRAILDHSPIAIYLKDIQSRFVLTNSKLEEVYGLRCSPIGKTISDILEHSLITEEFESVDKAVMANQTPIEYETVVHWPDSRPSTDFLTVKFPIFDADGTLSGVGGFDMDITARKRATKELRRLRHLLANIVDSMPSILVGVDAQGVVTQWNRKAASATGVEVGNAMGRPLEEVFPRLGAELSRVHKAMESRSPLSHDKVMTRVGDKVRYDDIVIYPLVSNGVVGAVIRVDDVTERVRIEEMMMQTEKMLSIGGLAAGMAHEINNPLAGMLQNAQLIRNRLKPTVPKNRDAAAACSLDLEAVQRYLQSRGIDQMLEAIMDAGGRAARIVENMLSFSRKSRFTVSHHDMRGLLDQTLELLSSDYDLKVQYDFRAIRMHRDYQQDVPTVPCEPNQIQQVFLNLLRNAAQAMHGMGDRQPELWLRIHQDGESVFMEIRDNGIGMNEETRFRVFEPFFTTKDVGTGTGLGLAVSYFIITQNHGGDIEVYSAPDNGTRFVVRLPLSREGE
ncbi:MAG: ATP-binding protein [Aquisalimonadaceae bacterium]